jgi:hypothetical protein
VARKADQRRDLPRDYWLRQGPQLDVGREVWRVWLLPGGGRPRLQLDAAATALEWTDADAVLRGSVQVQDARGMKAANIGIGSQVALEYAPRPGAPFRELWRMRVQEPVASLKDESASLTVANDMALLQASVDDFKYTRNPKSKPKGWRADEVIADVCARYGLPGPVLPAMKHVVKNYVRAGVSPFDVIVEMLKFERGSSGRRYVLAMEGGRVTVRPLRRSERLLVLGPSLVDAQYQATMRGDWATALTVRGKGTQEAGKDAKGHRRTTTRKLAVEVRSAAGVKRFGYVHRIAVAPDADTAEEARDLGMRHLATVMAPLKEAPITHPLIPGVKRGDSLRLQLDAAALRQVVFVKEARFQVRPGEATMDLQVTFDDPYVDEKLARIYDSLDAAAQVRGRVAPKKSRKKTASAPKPTAKAKQRADTPAAGSLGTRIAQRGRN